MYPIWNFKYKNVKTSYQHIKKNNIPFVTAKLAISKDNYTAHKNKKWITNKYSRGRVHLLRSCHDCIISSSETVTKDNSRLNCRIYGLEKTTPGPCYIAVSFPHNEKTNLLLSD